MQYTPAPYADPVAAALSLDADEAIACFCPAALRAQVARFQSGFPGTVSFAVKANPGREVLETMAGTGIDAFDVASVAEMQAVRAVSPGAALHYHNPVRAPAEIAAARGLGVTSWSVDCAGELAKIAPRPGDEIAVRLALKVPGAAYDFCAKFGAGPELAATLLHKVAEAGARPSLTFHPGTQCGDPAAWAAYIRTASDVARRAGVTLHRLNVGGGFASNRDGTAPDLEAVFAAIRAAAGQAFETPPPLVCEPGRGLVSEAVTLITRIKAIRDDGAVFLNDGLYGGLAEMRDMVTPLRFVVIGRDGTPRRGPTRAHRVFGPTCDSVDRLPGQMHLPADTVEGDFVLWPGAGAYAMSLSTRFNGYGIARVITVASPMPQAGQQMQNP